MEQVQDDPIRMLVGLITMATTNKVRDELQRALVTLLCSNNEGKNLWHALQGKEGVQLLISFLLLGVGGLSPPAPHQEYALGLLRLLSSENDESKRAITAALVDLLVNPIPDRPGAPFLALGLLTQLANDCPRNQIVMVESGVLGALTNCLSLCPPDDAIEGAATDLLCLLFSSQQLRRSESALGATSQLIAVLLEGGRGARCCAAKALYHLFLDRFIRNDKIAKQAVPPLVEILNTGSDEQEQHAAIAALARLLADFPFFAHGDAEVETISVDVLCRILSSNCSMELKRDAAELCSLIFTRYKISSTAAAACCVEPLVSLLVTELGPCHLPAVIALDQLVYGEKRVEAVVALGAVVPLVHLLKAKEDCMLQLTVCGLLNKLGKQRPACKEEMLNAGAIKKIDKIYLEEPRDVVDYELSKLLRLLTNNKRRRKRYVPTEQAKSMAKEYSKMMRFEEDGIRIPVLREKRPRMVGDCS